jgi:hypothetical protein
VSLGFAGCHVPPIPAIAAPALIPSRQHFGWTFKGQRAFRPLTRGRQQIRSFGYARYPSGP